MYFIVVPYMYHRLNLSSNFQCIIVYQIMSCRYLQRMSFFCRGDNEGNDPNLYNKLRQILIVGLLMLQKITGISDTAITSVMHFIVCFIGVLGKALSFDVSAFLKIIPKTLHTCRKLVNLDRDDFHKYVVCPKCKSIYPYEFCINPNARKCTYVKWPQHNIRRFRQPCNTQLYQGNSNIPKHMYCLKPASEYLQTFVRHSDFVSRCNRWRKRNIDSTLLADIYDGRLWKEEADGYLENDHNLYGLINIDWFQPFKHTTEPVGAIYLVLANLPRELRFKEDNVMLLGLLPGPDEPSLNVNTFIGPLIDDFIRLETGIRMADSSRFGNIYRLRILGSSSDLPATRKLCGFMSYSSKYGELIFQQHY